LLILDEATASLDSRQVQRLFDLVVQWKKLDRAVIFVSHRMEEIFRIADRYSVLRNGKTVGAGEIKAVRDRELVALMVENAAVNKVVQRERQSTAGPSENQTLRFEVRDLQTNVLKGVSLHLHDGELLGLGGLKGQGQRELLLALFGDVPYTGGVLVSGQEMHFKHPSQAVRHGLALVPGDRSREGLLSIRTILENLFLPSWSDYGFPLRMHRARQDGTKVAESLNLKMSGFDEPVSSLSGGNAQKVVIGKWLLRKPKLLLLDDPTKGVDVVTKAEFYQLLASLCNQGTAVLFYSSDDDELLGLCDRVLVMYDGVIRSELSGASLTHSNLVAASLGASNEDAV
jgi:ribose transport system ATP-binding protein